MAIELASIHRYPVKSCRGEALPRAEVEPWGLAGDRRWMVVDDDGVAITARAVHALLLVVPEYAGPGILLSAPDLPPLRVRTPDPHDRVEVAVWTSTVLASPAGAEADAWISKAIGTEARLVYLDDPTQRPTNPAFTRPGDRVSLADGYPLLLTCEESLSALNDLVAAGALAAEGPLPMARFRPNLVVRGAPAWSEDSWRSLRIGPVRFRVVKGCDRCVLTTLDPDTARGGKEPIASLARHRRWDGKVWFGVNLVPDAPPPGGATLRVGDEVLVLDAAAVGGGPPR